MIAQQFEIFEYDPNRDDGAYAPAARLWADSERAALVEVQNRVGGTITESMGKAALNTPDKQFIARSHAEKHRWPKVDTTGRLPQSDNEQLKADFHAGKLGA